MWACATFFFRQHVSLRVAVKLEAGPDTKIVNTGYHFMLHLELIRARSYLKDMNAMMVQAWIYPAEKMQDNIGGTKKWKDSCLHLVCVTCTYLPYIRYLRDRLIGQD